MRYFNRTEGDSEYFYILPDRGEMITYGRGDAFSDWVFTGNMTRPVDVQTFLDVSGANEVGEYDALVNRVPLPRKPGRVTSSADDWKRHLISGVAFAVYLGVVVHFMKISGK